MHLPSPSLGRRRAALLPFLLTMLSACAPTEPAPVLVPVVRLAAEIAGRPGFTSCEIDDEIRPALGCPSVFPLLDTRIPFPPSHRTKVTVELPENLRGRPLALRPVVATIDAAGLIPLPAVLTRGTQARVALEIEVPPLRHEGTLRILVQAFTLMPRPRRWHTRPITLPPQAILSVGLGVAPVTFQAGAPPVEFIIRARTPEGPAHTLLSERIDPADGPRGWIERRIDLGALAGQAVSFTFGARWLGPGADGGPGFGAPLFGAPLVLAPEPRGSGANVVLISLDTLRSGFVGGTLDGLAITPFLDRLAAQGTRFEQAVAPYPSTTASHMSLLTGVYPATHRTVFAGSPSPKGLPGLAGTLAEAGWTTGAVTENGMITAVSGFARGFDTYRENKSVSIWDARGDIETTFDEARSWLRRHREQRFFLFVHTYEVHDPYTPPPRHDRFSAPSTTAGARSGVENSRRKYAGEVLYADRMVEGLVSELARLGLDDDTIVVITSDHGEEFGEHGGWYHSFTVYDEVLRIPALLSGGPVPAGLRVAEQISLIDLAPTLLDLVGVRPPPDMQGQSLRPLLAGGRNLPGMRVRYMEGPRNNLEGAQGGRLIGARELNYKFIGREQGGDPNEIYDLARDPGEHKNLSANILLRTRGRQLLDRYRDLLRQGDEADVDGDAPRSVEPAVERKLRALGYVD